MARHLEPGLSPPWIVAHRGASAEAPENTESAFALAIEQGAEAIELDVQLTSDGIPFVWHDRDLKKLEMPGTIADHKAADLKRADAGRWFSEEFVGESPLALQEVLRRIGSRMRLLIEIKARTVDIKAERHRELAARVAKMLRANRLLKRCWLLCFDEDALHEARRDAHTIQTVLNMNAPKTFPADGHDRYRKHAALSVNIKTLSAPFASGARRLGKPLLTYVCNDDKTLKHALERRCDGIMSDRPGWLAQSLAD